MTEVRRRLASATVAAALLGAAAVPAVVTAPVAAAHSVLVSVDPEDGSSLDASPEQVALTFNEEVNQNFASVAVTSGEDTTNRAVGEPVVDGPTVSVPVEDLEPGAYTVGYRVTSADGHVVTGSSVFTVTGGTDGGSGADDGAGAGGSADSQGAENSDAGSGPDAAQDGADSGADISDETSGEDTGINPVIWVVGGLAVLLIGGAFVLLRRGN